MKEVNLYDICPICAGSGRDTLERVAEASVSKTWSAGWAITTSRTSTTITLSTARSPVVVATRACFPQSSTK